jgi:hypothetical protein
LIHLNKRGYVRALQRNRTNRVYLIWRKRFIMRDWFMRLQRLKRSRKVGGVVPVQAQRPRNQKQKCDVGGAGNDGCPPQAESKFAISPPFYSV